MIGYGIPRIVQSSHETYYDGKLVLSRYGGDDEIFYEWEEGYLWATDEEIADEFQFLRWNDFYLNIRARKIQRWFRSFEELPMACPCPE